MTPYEVRLLLHIHCIAEPLEQCDILNETLVMFQNKGLIHGALRNSKDSHAYELTVDGEELMDRILNSDTKNPTEEHHNNPEPEKAPHYRAIRVDSDGVYQSTNFLITEDEYKESSACKRGWAVLLETDNPIMLPKLQRGRRKTDIK